MRSTAREFRHNVHVALHDPRLQKALGNVPGGFIEKCRKALDALPEYDQLREAVRAIKDHTLDHLDHQSFDRGHGPPVGAVGN